MLRHSPLRVCAGTGALDVGRFHSGDPRGHQPCCRQPLQPALCRRGLRCAHCPLAVAVLSGLGAHRVLKDRRAALQAAVAVAGSSRLDRVRLRPRVQRDRSQTIPASVTITSKDIRRCRAGCGSWSINRCRRGGLTPSTPRSIGPSAHPLSRCPPRMGTIRLPFFVTFAVPNLVCRGERWGRYYEVRDPDSPLLKFLNVRYVISRAPIAAPGSLIRREDLPGNVVPQEIRIRFPASCWSTGSNTASDAAAA